MKRIKILTLALGILFSLHTAVFADKNYRIVLEKGDYYLRFPGYSSCDYEVSDAMGNYYHWDSVTRLYKKGRALAVLDLLKKSGSINLSGERLAIPLPNRNNFVSQTQDELRLQLTLWTADKNDIRNIMGTKLSINHTIEWWPGESAFFNLVRTTNSSDKDKIMSMLYAYFNDKGEGVNFQNMISAEYSEANNIHLFDTIDAEKKKKALDSLADMLAKTLYSSFYSRANNKTVFSNTSATLYQNNLNPYIKLYLQFCYYKKMPVFASYINLEDKNPFDYTAYREIDENEGEDLAKKALRYTNWGVEYTPQNYAGKYTTGQSVYNSLYDTLTTPNTRRENNYFTASINENDAYPLPYKKNGIDSPISFAHKMSTFAGNRGIEKTTKATKGVYTQNIDAGVDSWGLLTGSISMIQNLSEHIFARNGSRPAENLNTYFSKPENMLQGKMLQDDTAYRFSFADIERMSIVVPDINKVRAGDIILFSSGKDTVVGIVSKKTNDAITFISCTEDKGYAASETWYYKVNGQEAYTIRRLLIKTNQQEESSKEAPDWDLLDIKPETIQLELLAAREQNQLDKNTKMRRWIPNTGEYLILNDIRIKAANKAGVKLDIQKNTLLSLYLEGAVDRSHERGNVNNSNFYINTDGDFELALLDKAGIHLLPLGKLAKNGSKYSLVDIENTLPFSIDDNDSIFALHENRKMHLGIRPLAGKPAKPGDDIFLEFKIVNTAQNETIAKAQTKGKHYLAVYDKKLLWTANQYIDDSIDDWNDLYPYKDSLYDTNNTDFILLHGEKWQLENRENSAAAEEDRKIISHAVPGDLLVYEDNGTKHMAIIEEIDIPEDSDVVTSFNQIRVIHASQGSLKEADAGMARHDTWGTLQSTFSDYKLKRGVLR